MAEAPEIPEANDPFEKRIAISIAVLAVVLSVVEKKGDGAKTESILKKSEENDHWAQYQSKGIKAGLARVEDDLLDRVALSATVKPESVAEHRATLKEARKKYEEDQKEISTEAKTEKKEADYYIKVTERCHEGALALQIAIVLASVAILSRWRAMWIFSLLLGLLGAVVGITSFFIAH